MTAYMPQKDLLFPWRTIEENAALGLEVHAGHGLTFDTVGPIAALPELAELNIGHFLIAESIFTGLGPAIAEMRARMDAGRSGARFRISSRRREIRVSRDRPSPVTPTFRVEAKGSLIISVGIRVVRLALPQRSPRPLSVPCT